jgi:hypothetical protein
MPTIVTFPSLSSMAYPFVSSGHFGSSLNKNMIYHRTVFVTRSLTDAFGQFPFQHDIEQQHHQSFAG